MKRAEGKRKEERREKGEKDGRGRRVNKWGEKWEGVGSYCWSELCKCWLVGDITVIEWWCGNGLVGFSICRYRFYSFTFCVGK